MPLILCGAIFILEFLVAAFQENVGRQICIHGLGLAINRTINITLQLEAMGSGSLCLVTNTSTVELADIAKPEGDGDEPLARTWNNSAIPIWVCHVTPE
ncbi:UNVERIFIED_CONTAM: ribonucleases P/MRP protein subunit pop7 [Gekko kuhli]